MRTAREPPKKVCIPAPFSLSSGYIRVQPVESIGKSRFSTYLRQSLYVEESSHMNAKPTERRWPL